MIKKQRLLSLDALRGFVMFWIMSGEHIIHALAKACPINIFVWMSNQLHHTDWEGITFYDMIFPTFLFVAGVSMPFSFAKKIEAAGVQDANQLPSREKNAIYKTMFIRTAKLVVLGCVVNGLLHFDSFDQTRFASVLGRIGIAWFFAGIIFLNFNLKKRIIWCVSILVGYYMAMKLIPIPLYGAGNLSMEGSLVAYIDQLFLPGRLHSVVYDPEGILSTVPAVATALLGVFLGEYLLADQFSSLSKRIGILVIAAILLVSIGCLWNYSFPINKHLWSSSFVCFVAGFSLLFFLFFYIFIDILNYKKIFFPLLLIGSNSIFIYMAAEGLINFAYTADFLFGGLISKVSDNWQLVCTTVSITALQLGLLYFLYQKKWFFKV